VAAAAAEDLEEGLRGAVGNPADVLEAGAAANQDVQLHHLGDAVEAAQLLPGQGDQVVRAEAGGPGAGAH